VQEVEAGLVDASVGVIVEAIVKKHDVNTSRWYAERKGVDRGLGTKVQTETKLADGEIEGIVAAFGGDVEKLRAIRAALNPGSTPPAS
jgi:hypothetical protein